MLNLIAHIVGRPVCVQGLGTGIGIIGGKAGHTAGLIRPIRLSIPAHERIALHGHVRQIAIGGRVGLHSLGELVLPVTLAGINEGRRISRRGILLVRNEIDTVLSHIHIIGHRCIGGHICNRGAGRIEILSIPNIVCDICRTGIIIATVSQLLAFQRAQHQCHDVPCNHMERLRIIQHVVIREIRVKALKRDLAVCSSRGCLNHGRIRGACALTIQNHFHTSLRVFDTVAIIVPCHGVGNCLTITIIRDLLIHGHGLRHRLSRNVRRHRIHRAVHIQCQQRILLTRNLKPERTARLQTGQCITENREHGAAVLEIGNIRIIIVLRQNSRLGTVVTRININHGDHISRRNAIILIGFIHGECKRKVGITAVHTGLCNRNKLRDIQRTVGNHTVLNLFGVIIANALPVDILTSDAGQCIHIIELGIDGVIPQIQTGNTAVIHVTNIPCATQIGPAGLVHISGCSLNGIPISLCRNQTISVMIILQHLHANNRVAGIAADIQSSNFPGGCHIAVQIHLRQLNMLGLTLHGTDAHIGADFHKDLVRNRNRLALGIELHSRTGLGIHAKAMMGSSVAFKPVVLDNAAVHIQRTTLGNKHSAGRRGSTDDHVLRNRRTASNGHGAAVGHMHSASAVADIRHVLASAGQRHIVQRHISALNIQQTSTMLIALQPGQTDIGQSQ